MSWKLVFAVVGAIALGIVIRRHVRSRHADLVAKYEARVRPRLKKLASWIFAATMVLWVVLYLAAPEEDRGRLTEAMRSLFGSASPHSGPPDAKP